VPGLTLQQQLLVFIVLFSLFCLAAISIWGLNREKLTRYRQHSFILPTFLFLLVMVIGYSISYERLLELTRIYLNLQDFEGGFIEGLGLFIAFFPYLVFMLQKSAFLKRHPIRTWLGVLFLITTLAVGALYGPVYRQAVTGTNPPANPYLYTFLSIGEVVLRVFGAAAAIVATIALLHGLICLILSKWIKKGPEGRYPVGYKSFLLDTFYQGEECQKSPGYLDYAIREQYGEIKNFLLEPLPYLNKSKMGIILRMVYWLSKPYRLMIILFGGLLAWQVAFVDMGNIRFLMFAFVAIILVGEIYGFLSGDSKTGEKIAEIPDSVEKDFEAFYRDLKQHFDRYMFHARRIDGMDARVPQPDEENINLKGLPDEKFSQKAAHEFYPEYETFAQELKDSHKLQDQILGNFFKQMPDLDLGYAQMTRKVFDGESTLVLNPFFMDLTDYLVVPLLKQLMDNHNVLVIGGRASQDEELKNWMRSTIWKMMGTDQYFTTDYLGEGNTAAPPNIGILRANQVNHFKLIAGQREFLKKVGLIILVEPSRQITMNQLSLNIIANYCSDERVVVAMDRPVDGLLDNLSHTLNVRMKEVSALQQNTNPLTYTVVYNASNKKDMHQRVMENVFRYLGGGTEVFSLAQRHHLGEVTWLGDKKFPIVDMKWIAGQYYQSIADVAGLPHTQYLVEKELTMDPSLWKLRKKPRRVLVVEDEFNNMFDIRELYRSRATEICSLNIFSSNYMMRDYMLKNPDLFLKDKKAVPTIINDFEYSPRNLFIKIMVRLLVGPLRELEISDEFLAIHREGEDIVKLLGVLSRRYLDIGHQIHFTRYKKDEVNYQKNCYDEVSYIALGEHDSDVQEAIRRKFSASNLIVEDLAREKNYLGSYLHNQVYQMMLPTQFLTYSGKYYQVDYVNQDFDVLLKRSSEYIHQRLFYRQKRNYTLAFSDSKIKLEADKKNPHYKNWEVGSFKFPEARAGFDHRNRTLGDLKITVESARIEVQTEGYYQLNDYGNLATGMFVKLDSVPKRTYLHKDVLRLEFEGLSHQQRGLLALLLGELFQSTMPQTCDFIGVGSPNAKVPKPLEGALYKVDSVFQPDDEGVYIIEDSEIDLGIISSTARNISRFLEIITDYLIWYREEQGVQTTSQNEEKVEEAISEEPVEAAEIPKEEPVALKLLAKAEASKLLEDAKVEEVEADMGESTGTTGEEPSEANEPDEMADGIEESPESTVEEEFETEEPTETAEGMEELPEGSREPDGESVESLEDGGEAKPEVEGVPESDGEAEPDEEPTESLEVDGEAEPEAEGSQESDDEVEPKVDEAPEADVENDFEVVGEAEPEIESSSEPNGEAFESMEAVASVEPEIEGSPETDGETGIEALEVLESDAEPVVTLESVIEAEEVSEGDAEAVSEGVEPSESTTGDEPQDENPADEKLPVADGEEPVRKGWWAKSREKRAAKKALKPKKEKPSKKKKTKDTDAQETEETEVLGEKPKKSWIPKFKKRAPKLEEAENLEGLEAETLDETVEKSQQEGPSDEEFNEALKKFNDFLLFGSSDEVYGKELHQSIEELIQYLQKFQFSNNNMTTARKKER